MKDPEPKKRPVRDWVKKQAANQAKRKEGAPSGSPSATSTGLRQPTPATPKKPKTQTLGKSYKSPKLVTPNKAFLAKRVKKNTNNGRKGKGGDNSCPSVW